MKKIISFTACFIVLFSILSFTSRPWTLIGQKEASYGADRDILKVQKRSDVFTAIKIKVIDAGLDMKDMDVVFENGERINIPIQQNFRKGEESRIIDLPGKKRRIDRIEFLYDTKGIMNGKANVLVFGMR